MIYGLALRHHMQSCVNINDLNTSTETHKTINYKALDPSFKNKTFNTPFSRHLVHITLYLITTIQYTSTLAYSRSLPQYSCSTVSRSR